MLATPIPTILQQQLPAFSQLQPEQLARELKEVLSQNLQEIELLLTQTEYNWSNLMLPLEALEDQVQKTWSLLSHLHAVLATEGWRQAYNDCLPHLTDYHTQLAHNIKLYQTLDQWAHTEHFAHLDKAQQKIIKDELRDFHLAGVSLPPAAKERYATIQQRLAHLSSQFEEHVLDATEQWTCLITDAKQLQGIPQAVLSAARERAAAQQQEGWLLNLTYPCYLPVISYADNRALRQQIYTAYCTRASDQGPQAGQFDNTPILTEILSLRTELSQLLGFNNYAELSLATKMVQKPEEVIAFLQQLASKAKAKAQTELAELTAFAQQQNGINELQPWDIAYYSEKLCTQRYGINDELLRPYFPLEKVLEGLFQLTQQLYGMEISEYTAVDTWHPDVRFFQIADRESNLRGYFYLDVYARPQKQSGAWMDGLQQRWLHPDGSLQHPIAYLICNFTPPSATLPCLLTHEEVKTLFHEFGHGLHHMLTQVNYASVAGIHGVEWDAVELPSQFMEFFAWKKPVLDYFAAHYQTSAKLPEELWQRLHAAKNFHSGLKLVRQLEFALFDFHIHQLDFGQNAHTTRIQTCLDHIREEVGVISIPSWNRFQHSFSHIFAGGYAAGYYSYLWAEMLASDAFARFSEEGIFTASTGAAFLHTILEQGGSAPALELFKAFRGRPPELSALLQHLGISDTSSE